MKATREPLKRLPVVLRFDAENREAVPILTDRAGVARFDLPPASGKVLVAGIERYQGRLDGVILIELWSITQAEYGCRGGEQSGLAPALPARRAAETGQPAGRVAADQGRALSVSRQRDSMPSSALTDPYRPTLMAFRQWPGSPSS